MGEVRGWWSYSYNRANEINSPKYKANLVPQKMKCKLHTIYIQQLHGSTDSTLFYCRRYDDMAHATHDDMAVWHGQK